MLFATVVNPCFRAGNTDVRLTPSKVRDFPCERKTVGGLSRPKFLQSR